MVVHGNIPRAAMVVMHSDTMTEGMRIMSRKEWDARLSEETEADRVLAEHDERERELAHADSLARLQLRLARRGRIFDKS